MATNDFLPWALSGGSNLMDQATYSASANRTAGVTSGTADEKIFNKVQRQSAFMGAVIASLIVDRLNVDVLDNGDVAGVVSKLEAAVLDIVSDEGYATVAALNSEASTRSTADANLSALISEETTRAQTAEATKASTSALNSEIINRQNADSLLLPKTSLLAVLGETGSLAFPVYVGSTPRTIYLKWVTGPWDAANGTAYSHFLPWDSQFPNGCFFALPGTELDGLGNSDYVYQTYDPNITGVYVIRDITTGSAATDNSSRARVFGIGW